jgi:hypothetical protein
MLLNVGQVFVAFTFKAGGPPSLPIKQNYDKCNE